MKHHLTWIEDGRTHDGTWITESELPPPRRILPADESLSVETFYQQASEGTAFIWRGDFHKAKSLLQGVQKRIESKAASSSARTTSPAETFHFHRRSQAHRARLLSRLLISIEADLSIKLPRAPDISAAIAEAAPLVEGPFLISLRELLGMVGAHEWRKKGILIPALGERIHPHYAVYSPARGEYLELVLKAPLPPRTSTAFDIGAGTGVIAAVLAKRGVERLLATELDQRAVACAKDNIARLGLSSKVEILEIDLFPEGTADLIVCNPPWLPARPTSAIERAVYDENSRMLKSFLAGLKSHLKQGGEGWLIVSDLAELLGLREANELATWIENAGLVAVEVLTTRPSHPKSSDERDPLFQARSREVTRLFRLKPASSEGEPSTRPMQG